MLRVFSWSAAPAALILVMSLPQQELRAADNDTNSLKGTYAFTLTEKCVHQLSFNVPGFNSSFQIVDPLGAETYSGASDGLLVLDGKGGASIQKGRATNIMNAMNRLVVGPGTPITPIPLGFGLGPALPFTCTGSYAVSGGKVTAPLTCNAALTLPNAFNSTGFQSMFVFEGFVPENPDHLLLTDIGDTVQPVTIFFPGNPPPFVKQQRICTRSAIMVRISPEPPKN